MKKQREEIEKEMAKLMKHPSFSAVQKAYTTTQMKALTTKMIMTEKINYEEEIERNVNKCNEISKFLIS